MPLSPMSVKKNTMLVGDEELPHLTVAAYQWEDNNCEHETTNWNQKACGSLYFNRNIVCGHSYYN